MEHSWKAITLEPSEAASAAIRSMTAMLYPLSPDLFSNWAVVILMFSISFCFLQI
jgi:hypothetical protein